MSRSHLIRESIESIPESLPDDLETESENASEDEYEDDYEDEESSNSSGSQESFESYHEDDNNNNTNQNKSRPQSHKSNIPSRKPSALPSTRQKLQSGPSTSSLPQTNQPSKIPRKSSNSSLKEPKIQDNPHLPASRLKQLLDSDLIFFQENEAKDLKKLKELNKALIHHLKLYHKYGIQVLEEEYREERKRERERRERERKERDLVEKEKQARREEERKKSFEEWKKKKEEKKATAEPLSPRLFSEEIARLQNAIGEKDVEIKNLKDEIRSLNSVQRRQARALKDMDTERENLPKTISNYHEELMQFKEKARLLQIQADKDRKTITQQHEQIETLKAKVQRDEDAPEDYESLMNELEEKKKQLDEMDKKFAILMKAKESDSKKYKQQIKAMEAELQKLNINNPDKSPRRSVSASSLSSPSGSKIPVRKKPS